MKNAAALSDDQRYAVFAVIAGGILLALGSLMDWIKITAPLIGTYSKSGVSQGSSDGWYTLIGGLVIAGIAFGLLVDAVDARRLAWGAILVGIGGLGLGLYEINDIDNRVAAATSQSSLVSGGIGNGLVVVMVGAAVVLAGGIYLLRNLAPRQPIQKQERWTPPERPDDG